MVTTVGSAATDGTLEPVSSLDPEHVRTQRFESAVRGYEPREVDDFLGTVAEAFATAEESDGWHALPDAFLPDALTGQQFTTVWRGYDKDAVDAYRSQLARDLADRMPDDRRALLAPPPLVAASATKASSPWPLDGVRVLAIEQTQALPFATQMLARLGAEVVKVEHPERGDLGRHSQPSTVDAEGQPMGATFARNNLNKRSLGIDLSHPDAAPLMKRLVPRFDIIAENLKPGSAAKFGLDYDAVRAIHPEAIFLSVSGFGASGDSPYRDWPASAPIIEALSGLYAFNRAPGEPIRVSPVGALGGTAAGLFAVIGVLAALRRRDESGQGAFVDVAMLDSMIALADIVPNFWSMGADPRTPTPMINDGFTIADGELVIQVETSEQFATFVSVIGKPEWADDQGFATRTQWRERLGEIERAVAEWAVDRSAIDAAEALATAGIAAAPVLDAEQVVNDPHAISRGSLVSFPDGRGDMVLTHGNPIKMSDMPEAADDAPPSLGQHTDDILREELDLSDEELETLRGAGVVAAQTVN